jgi:hypothetical protein
MSNEIILNVSVAVRNGYLVDQFAPGQILIDQDTPAIGGYVQEIGTSEEDINFGETVYPEGGILILQNLSPSNFVNVGPSDSGAMVVSDRIHVGQVAVHMLSPGVTFRAKADTAAVQLFVRLYPFDVSAGS